MVLDQIKNLKDYEGIGFNADLILAFIEEAEEKNLPCGKYDLDGEDLFALIQEYETENPKDRLYEAHKQYIDIQYMAKGCEVIYGAGVDTLTLVEDLTDQRDLLLYDLAEVRAKMLVREKCFALFLPQDGHMPCCFYKKEPLMVRKIVFKIRIK